MDIQRERIQDDLRGVIDGTVECNDPITTLYSTDGSVYQMRPAAVVCPRHWRDVSQAIIYAREHGLGVHCRGAGSSLAGESLGEGIVLDFSQYMRRVIDIKDGVVRVQPGVVRERLNDGLRPFGVMFGPDGGNLLASTIGGQVGINPAGGSWLRYGTPGRSLVGIKAVLADGSLAHFDEKSALTAEPDSPVAQLTERLKAVYKKHAALIDATPEKSSIHHAGYNLTALKNGNIDFLRLLAGSEGTLAAFTELEIRLHTIPQYQTAVLFFFDSIRKAALAAQEAIHLDIDSCDLMDRRHLRLVSEFDARIELIIPHETEAALLIFCSSNKQADIHNKLRILNERLCLELGLAFAENYSYDEHELEIYSILRNSIQPTPRENGFVKPVCYVDDVTVDPHRLDEFFAQLLTLFQNHGISSSIFCHAPQGQMSLHPLLDMHDPQDRAKLLSFAEKYYELAWKFGGYLGREQGCGLSRLYYLQQQSPEYYEVYRDVKTAFDPDGILQPQKIIASKQEPGFNHLRSDIAMTTQQIAQARTDAQAELSPGAARQDTLEDLTVLQMDWRQDLALKDCFTCTDCGACRGQKSGLRSCPMFRQDLRESFSPRAKANLVRALALRQLDLTQLLSDEVKEILDSCFNCRSCQFECLHHAPVPQMILQARGAYVSAKGLNFSDRLIAQFDKLSRLAIRFRPVATALINSSFGRFLLEKTLGISANRKIPPIPKQSFLDEYAHFDIRRQNLSSDPDVKRVFFFVSAYANYHDVALAEAAMKILQYNNVEVVCNITQKPSGLSALTTGMIEKAASIARHNVNIMADAIQDSCSIVCVEPADTYCIKHEYPILLENDTDAQLVAENTYDLCQYLWKLHLRQQLNLNLQPIKATFGYHAPCRLRALDIGYPAVDLLQLIPGLNVQILDSGCCGMAGLYGMQAKNFNKSIRIGMPLITQLRKPAIQASTTDCSSCSIAMEHKSTKPCVHPLKILACSYGIMPEIAETIRRPIKFRE